ncbi:MAG TPA: glycosyltransferase family 39 protein [Bacteroidales bacterium]|nr:glycosyltransferase family 39 protein [Bacteroidales bacterium]
MITRFSREQVYTLCIGLLAALLFMPFLGGVHLFDWDEINFAESAREMIVSRDYLTVQINFIPFREKPPLFIWMQVISMKIFGINEFAARFPNAICGIVSLLTLFTIGRKIIDVRFALLWVFLYAGSILPFFYFKSGIIDPWFNLFIFLGIYQFYLYVSQEKKKLYHSAGSALFIGLAILTKGPVAFLVFFITAGIFLILKKFKVKFRMSDMLVFVVVLSFTGGFWFILQILEGNFSIISDFIVYQIRLFRTRDAGHGGFLLYHFVVLFAGVFPASVFAIPALFGSRAETGFNKDFYRWMIILFWVVLLLFTVVKTKIVHYSSLCYFPLTFAAAWSVYHSGLMTPLRAGILRILAVSMGVMLALVVVGITLIDQYKEFIISRNLIGDPFAVACLGGSGEWKGYEAFAGIILIAGLTWFSFTWKNRDFDKGIMIVTVTVSLFMFTAMLLIVPRIEAYSQRPVVEFFKSVNHQDAYLETIGYKSYAHLFYGRSRNHVNAQARDENWILTGNIDKVAYFAVKITGKDKVLQEYPELELLYEKHGFAFFKRTPLSSK